ncbi:MAG: MoaD/ThiS family protein [Deltaproteobacteria bacterium]|uniref:MoaD/ThiS family protein n=1 Tax=Desulfobacula sp. TaxID=2593537 RepID=UPI0019B33765|nr:MoaD/ThiS family protein [Candidatus Desulfobacula maris]MBL6992332.1 MoaD/ThiS family protein [Desulfobacula sp.]
MSVKIHVHVTHRRHTNGQKTIDVQGNSVKEALNNFVTLHPGMKHELFDKNGGLRHYIEIYLNNESAYPGELNRPVKKGDEIQIITFLAGG